MAAANPLPLTFQEKPVLPIEDADDTGGSDDLMDDTDETTVNTIYVAEQSGLEGVSTKSPRTSELTLSFKGEVYVFPAVTPDKVQTVLLLLGERDIPTTLPTLEHPFENSRVIYWGFEIAF